MERRDGEVMHSLESIQWMIGSIELCGGLHFRTMLLPCSDFTVTFFSFCCNGGTKRKHAKEKQTLVSTQVRHKHLHTHLPRYVKTSRGDPRQASIEMHNIGSRVLERVVAGNFKRFGCDRINKGALFIHFLKILEVSPPGCLLSSKSRVTWFVSHMCLLPQSSPLPIVDNPTGATEECFTWHQLKSVSGETVVRETEGRRSPRREPVTQVEGYTEVLFTFAHRPMCLCVHVCTWLYVDYHVIACDYLLGGCAQSSQYEPPSAYKWTLYKAQQEKDLYAGFSHSL